MFGIRKSLFVPREKHHPSPPTHEGEEQQTRLEQGLRAKGNLVWSMLNPKLRFKSLFQWKFHIVLPKIYQICSKYGSNSQRNLGISHIYIHIYIYIYIVIPIVAPVMTMMLPTIKPVYLQNIEHDLALAQGSPFRRGRERIACLEPFGGTRRSNLSPGAHCFGL